VFVPSELFGVKMLGMSYTGAAITCALTAMVVFLSVRLIVRSLTHTSSNPRILRHLLAAAVAGAVIVSLSKVVSVSGILMLIIFGVLTVVVFLATLAALKEFSREDIDYFLDLVNPKKMFSYMGEEMKNKR
jgi:hypothetical protein